MAETTPPLADMSEEQLLAHAEQQHQRVVDAERELFRAAYQWAVIHNPERLGPDTGKPGRERARRLGGPGTPLVTEHCAATFGARIGRSPFAAQRMIADAIDVHLRLPQLAARVEGGEVKVSYARHVADATRELTEDEAAYVDGEVAESADGRLPWTRFETLVGAKVKAAAPELARRKEEQAARATFAKKVRKQSDGMATFMVRAEVATIDEIDGAVTALAKRLADVTPDATEDERRVHAIRLLANPGAAPDVAVQDVMPTVQLYVHVSAEASGDGNGIARLEGHGPVTEAWIARVLGPRCTFKVTPVIDLAGQAPVDAYEIPARHRTAVHLMTPADVFPHASNTSRSMEIDHTHPWAAGGRSEIGNYGPMTRRHHRIKTHTAWDVRQPFPGIYVWRDPYGAFYLVDHTGTRRIPGGREDRGDPGEPDHSAA